jgi:hypothetical protein
MQRTKSALLGVFTLLTGALLSGCGGPNLVDRVNSPWGLGICGTIIVILDIIAILEVAASNRSFGSKALWVSLIVFFPVGGLLFYHFFGD